MPPGTPRALLATPCKQAVKDKRIMIVMGERTGRGMNSDQGHYSSHFNAIDKRLKRLGLNSITQEEMWARIAQAEIDAYLNNDTEAALNASKNGVRFHPCGASFPAVPPTTRWFACPKSMSA